MKKLQNEKYRKFSGKNLTSFDDPPDPEDPDGDIGQN